MQGVHGERASKYLEKGYGSLLGFELKNGEDAGKKFIDNLELLYHVANKWSQHNKALFDNVIQWLSFLKVLKLVLIGQSMQSKKSSIQ